ncbi:ribonuclease H [Trifolium pratense]|uniref:Ribonuclease H n=1 Tax=Trifolium pratense TaxID=57577 RepID=A0A2K3M7N3_TRIPR|nr:ribonuclease H [Trifolium pratense]
MMCLQFPHRVPDLNLVSSVVSLLKWRGINEKDAVWFDLLCHRYGFLPSTFLSRETTTYDSKASLWWRDVVSVGETMMPGWFRSNTSCVVGNGSDISFWNTKWCGNTPFGDLFPNLYARDFWQHSLISDRMISSRDGLIWRWDWRDALTQSEEYDFTKLKELLLDVNLNPNSADRWRWIIGSAGSFSVNSYYNFLVQLGAVEDINSSLLLAFKNLWKNDVPLKVSVFGWRLLLQKLPTRAALVSKGIITNPHESSCAFCFRHVESCSHLFLQFFSNGVEGNIQMDGM